MLTGSADEIGTPVPERRKRRIFLWVFLAVQAGFILWLVTGGMAADHGVTHCTGQYCKGATEAGSAVGIGLIFVFWLIVDLLLAIPYGVYKVATRERR
jgi:hypothetical protein